MPDANLKVVVAADITNLQTAMQKAGGVTQDFANKSTAAVNQTTEALKILGNSGSQSIALLTQKLEILKSAQVNEKDIARLGDYNRQIKAVEDQISSLGEAGTSSFAALGAGATKGLSSIRQLAYILPGIGVAGILGAVAGPIIDGFKALGDAIFGVTEAQKAYNATESATLSAGAKATATVSELRTEIDLAKEGFIKSDEVVKHYNETIGKTTGQVTSLGQAESELNKKGEDYIKFTLLKAAATFAYQKSAEAAVKALFVLSKRPDDDGLGAKAIDVIVNKLGDESSAYKAIAVNADKLAAIIGKADGFNFFSDDKTKKTKAAGETIVDLLNKTTREIQYLNSVELNLGLDKSTEKISILESAIKELITKFKVDPNSQLILRLYAEIQALEPTKILKFKHDAQKDLENEKLFIPISFKLEGANGSPELNRDVENLVGTNALKNLSISVGINFDRDDSITQLKKLNVSLIERVLENGVKVKIPIEIATPKELDTALNAAAEKVDKFSTGVSDIINTTFTNGLIAIGEGIGKALADGGNIGDIFNGLFKALGAGIKQLGEYLIQFYTIKKLLSGLNLSPAAGLAIGLGLIVLGSLIESRLSKKTQGFATGVQNFGGGLALVGERGPELLNLPAGSDVIPNGIVNNIGNGEGGSLVATGVVRGTDLLLLVNRAQHQNKING